MGQSNQAEDKRTFRGSQCDKEWSECVLMIARIIESKTMTEMEKIGQWQFQGGKMSIFFPGRLTEME